ncbi:MAG: alpha-2-macroglobulin [Planctomycetota bacterium]
MNRILLACNAVLALLLAIRLADLGMPAHAGESEGGQAARILVEREAIPGGFPDGRVRSLLLDFGRDTFDEVTAEPVDLGIELEPRCSFACFKTSRRTARIVFSDPLPPGRLFHVHFGREIEAPGGSGIPAGTAISFESGRQSLRAVRVEDRGVDDFALLVEFLFPAAREDVEKAVSIREGARAIACRCEAVPSDPTSFLFLSGEPWPERVAVEVEPGLRALGGDLPMRGRERRLVRILEPLELTGVAAETSSIELCFNRSIPLPEPGLVRIDPPVPFQVLRSSRGIRLAGGFEAGSVWSVSLPEGFPGKGRLRLDAPASRSVLIPDRGSDLQLSQSGTILSSKAVPAIGIRGVNVDEILLRLSLVYPNNVVRLLQRRDSRVFGPAPVHRIPVEAARNEEFAENVDLGKLLPDGVPGFYEVELWDGKGDLYPRRRLLQVTDLGVTLRAAKDAAAAQVVRISSGEPVAGAEVEVVSPTNQVLAKAKTDGEGKVLLRWPAAEEDRRAFLVHAREGNDQVFVDLSGLAVELADEGLDGRPYAESREAWVWPSRGIARPGETLEASVLLRSAAGRAVADEPVTVEIRTPDGKTWRERELRSGTDGMLVPAIDLPIDAPTGSWSIAVKRGSDSLGSTRFLVEAFVPNRLEAFVEDVPEVRIGKGAEIAVRANWLDGAPAAGRPVELRMRLSKGDFRPEGFDGWSFEGRPDAVPPGELDPVRGVLDERGRAVIAISLPARVVHQTLHADLSLSVLDPSGRAVRASAKAEVLRPDYQIGIRAAPGKAELAAVRADGSLFPERLEGKVRLERLRWAWRYRSVGRSRWRWVAFVERETVGEWPVLVERGRGEIALPESPGEGWLVAVAGIGDQEVEQRLGPAVERPDRLRVAAPDKPVAPGTAAVVTATSPSAGRGFVTLESDTILAELVVDLEAGPNRIEVPIPAGLAVPNVHVVVTLTRAASRSGPGEGPPWLIGGASIRLARPEIAILTELRAEETALPGSRVFCELHAEGATRAFVALVDEGVLGITGHESPDPLGWFLAPRRLAADGADGMAHLLSGMRFAPGSKTGGDGGEEALPLGGSVSPLIRPLAFSRTIALSPDGRGRVEFDLPDYEGRLRWMVVAAGPARMGGAFASTTVKAPLGLRLAGPRMASPTDRFLVPLTLRNDTESSGAVRLSWSCSKGLVLPAPPPSVDLDRGAMVSLDVEVRVEGVPSEEEPEIRVVAEIGGERSEVAQKILVRRPSVFASEDLGIRLGERRELRIAEDWQPGFEATLSLSAFPDRHMRPLLESLLSYPYGCVEQTTSKGMALLACSALLPRILGERAEGVHAEAMAQAAADRLLTMQVWNGGFASWPGSREEYAFGTVWAAGFLLAARDHGLVVPEGALSKAVRRVEEILLGAPDLGLRCHAVEVLSRAGRPVEPRLDWLCRCTVGPEERALLATALARIGSTERARALLASEEGDGLGAREQDGLLGSPIRQRALRFSALLAVDPADPALPGEAAVLQRLALAPDAMTTQEQARVLGALADYFRVQPPAGEARIAGTLDGRPLAPVRDGAVRLDARPGSVLVLDEGSSGFALLSIRGYRPAADTPPDRGLALRVRFVDPDTGAEVRELKRGRVYDAMIEGSAAEGLRNFAITHVLPAGVEAELPLPGVLRPEPPDGDLAEPDCIERRDDRVLFFFAKEVPTSFRIRHRVRAVFPGSFDCEPILATSMYEPGSAFSGQRSRIEILP